MRLDRGGPRNARFGHGVEDALLPMINIVFLLMIFFLAAGRFGPGVADNTAESRRDDSLSAAPRVLMLNPDGWLEMDGEYFRESELGNRALTWRNAPLDLHAPANTPADQVLRLLNRIKNAGVTEVRLLTVQPASTKP